MRPARSALPPLRRGSGTIVGIGAPGAEGVGIGAPGDEDGRRSGLEAPRGAELLSMADAAVNGVAGKTEVEAPDDEAREEAAPAAVAAAAAPSTCGWSTSTWSTSASSEGRSGFSATATFFQASPLTAVATAGERQSAVSGAASIAAARASSAKLTAVRGENRSTRSIRPRFRAAMVSGESAVAAADS